MERIIHPISPIYDKNSKILILGSFPSVKSREQQFFYGHPQNRFWKTLAGVLNTAVPLSTDDKKVFLLENHIAVWDVIGSCTIKGSSDSSIKDVVVNDFSPIFNEADIKKIYANGNMAYSCFKRYSDCGRDIVKLPSTSPANAAFSLEKLENEWRVILSELKP